MGKGYGKFAENASFQALFVQKPQFPDKAPV
jgi:hypothetical protein